LRCLPVSAAVEPPNTLFADDRCDQVLLAWTRPILSPTDVLYQLGAKVPFGQYPQLAEWRGPDRISP
jgi:hypothetical protein